MTSRVGAFFPERRQPPLSPEEKEIVNKFHHLLYHRWLSQGGDTLSLSWYGYELLKCPLDLWIYQEILVRSRPDFVVETGTYRGGSAMYLAMLLDQVGHGRVLTVDIEHRADRPQHPRITYLTGSSVDPAIVARVRETVGEGRALVVLDSDHRAQHVFDEIMLYKGLVRPGDYLIVEDTNINGHPAFESFGPGPWEAVDRFLAESTEFDVDTRCERFLMTLNPRGYLRRRSLNTEAP